MTAVRGARFFLALLVATCVLATWVALGAVMGSGRGPVAHTLFTSH